MGEILSAMRFKSALDAASTVGASIRDRGCGIECGSDRNSFVSLLVKSVEHWRHRLVPVDPNASYREAHNVRYHHRTTFF